MGFALWVEGDTAWAQGTHEYRPMGTAVVGAGSIFTPRDFSRRRKAPERCDASFAGLFASLGEMNDWLKKRVRRPGRSQRIEIFFEADKSRLIPPF
ncbi:MAG: hypothetical protein HY858_06240 [Candidatus Solibacter usitatus]|nr:hypothetical protein [Candidatus Solibacter usitatus]